MPKAKHPAQPEPMDETPLEFGTVLEPTADELEPSFAKSLPAAELGDLNPTKLGPGGVGYATNPPVEPTPDPDAVEVDIQALRAARQLRRKSVELSSIRIRLARTYSGRRTNEQPIFPGEYAINDPALFGLGEYLVENGQAKLIEDAKG